MRYFKKFTKSDLSCIYKNTAFYTFYFLNSTFTSLGCKDSKATTNHLRVAYPSTAPQKPGHPIFPCKRGRLLSCNFRSRSQFPLPKASPPRGLGSCMTPQNTRSRAPCLPKALFLSPQFCVDYVSLRRFWTWKMLSRIWATSCWRVRRSSVETLASELN